MDNYTEAILQIQEQFTKDRERAIQANDEKRLKAVDFLEEFFTQQLSQYTRFQELLQNYANKNK